MILAAGFGTRLGELGSERPKPLMPVADVPLVRWALALLRDHGVSDVIVNTHHLGEQIEAELGSEVLWSHERPDILGTGGGVRKVASFFGDAPFFLINGKIVAEVDLDAVLDHHRRVGALATLVVREDPRAAFWGAVDVDRSGGRVLGIRGAGRFMFTGIHIVEPALVATLPPTGFSNLVDDAYLPALARGAFLGAYIMNGYFWEHSTPERYLAGNLNVLRGLAQVRHPPGPLRGFAGDSQVSPHATLREPVLVGSRAVIEPGAVVGPDVVVGRRARVTAGVRLERSVVWPDAHVTAATTDAIITPRRVLRLGD
jgi:NDP-sugar pyrophosphorylase family protein